MTSSTPRRAALRNSLGLFGMVTAVSLMGSQTTKAAESDNALIAACRHFKDIDALMNDPASRDDEWARLDALLFAALEDIAAHLPPTTQVGLQALAQCAHVHWLRDETGEPAFYDAQEWLALAMIESVMAMAMVSA